MSSVNFVGETPDVETASEDYASRFSGEAGRYFLDVQAKSIQAVMGNAAFCSVLDVGGGHGQLVPLFMHRGCELTILGSNDVTHRRVRESYPGAGIHLATGSILSLPFPDRSFDLVVAVRLVPHVSAWPALIGEFCRVARHSVIIDYPTWLSLNALTPLLFKVKKSLEGNTRTYTSFLGSELRRAFHANTFSVVAVRKQFFLPMFVHRAAAGARVLQGCERVCRTLGLTGLLGSPVVMRADRISAERPGA